MQNIIYRWAGGREGEGFGEGVGEGVVEARALRRLGECNTMEESTPMSGNK